jgi:hypothetical protein
MVQEAAGNIDISEKIEFVVEIEHSICTVSTKTLNTKARAQGCPAILVTRMSGGPRTIENPEKIYIYYSYSIKYINSCDGSTVYSTYLRVFWQGIRFCCVDQYGAPTHEGPIGLKKNYSTYVPTGTRF